MRSNFGIIAAIVAALAWSPTVLAGGHTSHGEELEPLDMTREQIDGIREKIKKFANYTDDQVRNMMARLTNESGMLSAADVTGDVGVLVLAHGFHGKGFTQFEERFEPISAAYPTAYGFGLFAIEAEPMKAAVDSLEAAGAKTILVVPATTAENSTMVRQWKFILGDLDEASYLEVPRVKTETNFIWAPNPMSHPYIGEIIRDLTLTVSKDPANEAVLIIGHGPSDLEDNIKELATLNAQAEWIQQDVGFDRIMAANVQDDAPVEMREANVANIRKWVTDAQADGKTVIVKSTVLTEAGVIQKLKADVEDLGVTFVDTGLMMHPRFIDWLNEVMTESLSAVQAD